MFAQALCDICASADVGGCGVSSHMTYNVGGRVCSYCVYLFFVPPTCSMNICVYSIYDIHFRTTCLCDVCIYVAHLVFMIPNGACVHVSIMCVLCL